MMCFTVSSNCSESSFGYLFPFLIFLLHDIWIVMPNRAAIISFSVYPFRSPLDSHRNMSSNALALLCLPILSSRTLFILLFCVE